MNKLLITGANGFLGKAVLREIEKNSVCFDSISTFRSSQYDLRRIEGIKSVLSDKKPDTIIHLAATVGGIGANAASPGTFFYENLIMGTQLIEEARLSGVKKFVLISTICAYPKFTPVPFKEKDLWNGYPEETNAPYGIAKKALMIQLESYKKQYGFHGISLLPVNLYGPEDNFNLQSSHVIPAMIRKMHIAKENSDSNVTLWGDGSPSREFLYVEDAARAVRLATENYNSPDPVNLGSGMEISMKKLADMVKKAVGFEGEIIWDASKPNGQPRRCLDVSKAKQFGFTANMTLPMGLEITYKWFQDHMKEIENSEQAGASIGHGVSK